MPGNYQMHADSDTGCVGCIVNGILLVVAIILYIMLT